MGWNHRCRFMVLLAVSVAAAQQISQQILVDQFGWRPNDTKIAIFANPQTGQNSAVDYVPGTTFQLRRSSDNQSVFSGNIQAWKAGAVDEASGDKLWKGDFSSFTQSGDYYVYDPTNNLRSFGFTISDTVYNRLLQAAVKAFYYQRCGCEVSQSHGGNWNHPPCHVHSSGDKTAARWTTGGEPRDVSGGWHDAGDYNKYTMFAAYPVWSLLYAWEQNPGVFGDATNIPESGNNVPDILDEVKWELDWFLKMQLADGSVANRVAEDGCTDQYPHLATNRRYWTEPTSWATGAFIVATAAASRSFARYQSTYPGYADTLLARAQKAWAWLAAHPTMTPASGIDYGSKAKLSCAAQADHESKDAHFRVWASAELLLATANPTYKSFFESQYTALGSWDPNHGVAKPMPRQFGYLTYCRSPLATTTIVNEIRGALDNFLYTNGYGSLNLNTSSGPGYQNANWGYYWGSNRTLADWGISSILGSQLNIRSSHSDTWHRNAAQYLHFMHGRNPLNWCYLSNMSSFGAEKSVDQIYHTWFHDGSSLYDGASSQYGPAPGILAGGPNGSFWESRVAPPYGEPPAKAYKNWNTGWNSAGNYNENSWEVTEPGIYYQSSYVWLLSCFATAPQTPPPPQNSAPLVRAGNDTTITAPATLVLSGSVTDDALPSNSLTLQWSVTSGTGVTFANKNSATSGVQFAAPGTYQLRLSASDGALSSYDELLVQVLAQNTPPPPDTTSQSDQLTIYSDAHNRISGSWSGNGTLQQSTSAAIEGTTSWQYSYFLSNWWDGFGLNLNCWGSCAALDLSGYDSLQIAYRGPASGHTLSLQLKDAAGGSGAAITLTPQSTARTLRISLAALKGSTNLSLSAISEISLGLGGALSGSGTLVLDNIAALRKAGTPPPLNSAPAVEAGANQSTMVAQSITLQGQVSDDGLPSATLTTQWRAASSATNVTFVTPSATRTEVSFAAEGSYLLILQASDGALSSSDSLWVTVTPRPMLNAAPSVFALAPQGALEQRSFSLAGTVSDDGLPAGTLSVRWRQLQGPSALDISDSTATSTNATALNAGSYQVVLWAWDGALSSADTITFSVAAAAAPGRGRGTIEAAYFTAISGSALSALDAAPSYPSAPTFIDTLSAFEIPSRRMDSYGVRIRALLYPSRSGSYSFYIASDDNSELKLSSSSSPQNARTICGVSRYTAVQAYTATAEQQSVAITLSADSVYYIEARMKEGGGNDHLSVAWKQPGATTPELIDGQYLAPYREEPVTASNTAPLVNAGTTTTITMPAQLQLNGEVSDDGLPGTGVQVRWSVLGATGLVTFVNSSSATTAVSFSEPGEYLLRLTADDGDLVGSDDIAITVKSAPQNSAPVIVTGGDKTAAVRSATTLGVTISDDGLPGGSLTINWTVVEGPGGVTLLTPQQPQTEAIFDATGLYTLQISASDGLLSNSDVVVVSVIDTRRALLLCGSVPLGDNDLRVKEQLEGRAWVVDGCTPAELATRTLTDYDLILISASVASSEVPQSLAGVAVPLLCWEAWAYPLLGMSESSSSSYGQLFNSMSGSIAAPTHAAAAGLSGTIALSSSTTESMYWATPAPSATIVLTLATPAQAGLFTYERGAAMVARSAPARRAGFFFGTLMPLRATTEAWRLFDATVLWLTETSRFNTPPAVSVHPVALQGVVGQNYTLSATISDDATALEQLQLTWRSLDNEHSVFFDAPTSATTQVQFSAPGSYRLEFSGYDGELLGSTMIEAIISALPINKAPLIEAGADTTIVAGTTLLLKATLSDDELPGSGLSCQWSQLSGPQQLSILPASGTQLSLVLSQPGSYQFRCIANDGELTSSDDIGVTVVDKKKTALLVVGGALDNGEDAKIRQSLIDNGLSVSRVEARALSAGQLAECGLVVFSSSVNSSDLNISAADVRSAALVCDPWIYPLLGMSGTASSLYGTVSRQSKISLVDATHPLAAGLQGIVTVSSFTQNSLGWGKPSSAAVVVATISGDSQRPTIFAYPSGAAMVSGSAPAKRVGFFLTDGISKKDTPELWRLFSAAVSWSMQ